MKNDPFNSKGYFTYYSTGDYREYVPNPDGSECVFGKKDANKKSRKRKTKYRSKEK